MPLLLCAVLCRCSRWLSCVLSFCSCTARVFIHSLSAPLYRPLSLRSAIVPLSWPVLCWPSVYLLPLPVRCIAGFAPCWPRSAMLLCTAYHRHTFPARSPYLPYPLQHPTQLYKIRLFIVMKMTQADRLRFFALCVTKTFIKNKLHKMTVFCKDGVL